jgi:hypothetical protein
LIGHRPARDFSAAPKSAIIRFNFSVHSGYPASSLAMTRCWPTQVRRLILVIAFAIVGQAGSGETGAERMPDFQHLAAAVIADLTPQERATAAAYLNESAEPAGAATIGGRQVVVDHPYVVAFVDRKPGANWMHPCRYMLLDPDTDRVTSFESDRPPAFGILPSTWRVIARPPGLQEWQLIRIAPTH